MLGLSVPVFISSLRHSDNCSRVWPHGPEASGKGELSGVGSDGKAGNPGEMHGIPGGYAGR